MKLRNRRDLYGLNWLEVGESHVVAGRTRKQAQVMVSKYSQRRPEFVHRDFELAAVDGGVLVKRVR
jgi:hypothetical protein